jgi:hypothetical protein
MIKSHNFYFFLLYKSFYKYVRTALGGPVKIPQVRNVRGDQERLFKLVTLNCILNRITGVTFGC